LFVAQLRSNAGAVVRTMLLGACSALLWLTLPVQAIQTTAPVQPATVTADSQKKTATPVASKSQTLTESSLGLTELPPVSASNQIPLLNNRFRIDDAVEEITLIFFRKKGSPSVILVKPDGSKVYARTAKEQQMEWYDDKTYDLIKMKKPTPGPWQAVGEILPESRIMVLTDIDLVVDPLPKDMMAGETLKVAARLTNNGQLINARDFRDVLQLDVLLISTQKEQYDNFNQTVLEFTSFVDDGKNYDERARDAVFTGEFKLDMPSGEWIPKYIVKTPLYTRELLQDPVIIQRAPVKTEVVESFTEADQHKLTFSVAADVVAGDSISLQGRIRFPNGEVQSYTLGEQPGNKRTLGIANAGIGTYRVESTMFGKTVAGREFVMALPEVTFAAVGQKVEVPEIAAVVPATTAVAGQVSAVKAKTAAVSMVADNLPPPEPFPLGLVITVNVLILLFGGGFILVLMNDRAKTMLTMVLAKVNPKLLLKGKNAAANESKVAPAAMETGASAQKNSKRDEILDLSLPDD
jgi:uncharacterized protein (TIGR03503 family)